MPTIRVLLVDDQSLLRLDFRAVLEQQPDLEWSARPATERMPSR